MSIVLEVLKIRRTLLIICSLLFGILIAGLSYRNHYFQSAEESQASSAHCDDGVGAAKPRTAAVASATAADLIASASEATWTPKINDAKPPGPAPAGMVWIPGGHFWMRTGDPHMSDTRPWRRVYVDDFWMDRTEGANEQFAEFVKATGYVTVAELKPRAEDYPGARPENLVAGSGVFTPPKSRVALNDHLRKYRRLVMKRIAFFIFCLLLAGHPAQRLSAIQSVDQDIIAIDILLDPDATMVKKAKALNARLRENYPKGFELGALHAPHISVAQRFVRAKDFDSVTAAVRNVLDAERPEGWQLKTIGYDYVVWAGVAVTVIVIERTPELERLQRKVLDAIAPFTVERGTAAAFVTSPASPDINPETINYVETFVQKWAGKNYVPHVTAGVAHEDFVKRLKAAPYKSFTFKIAGAGIYQLGNFGTAAKRLWSWTPAPVAHK